MGTQHTLAGPEGEPMVIGLKKGPLAHLDGEQVQRVQLAIEHILPYRLDRAHSAPKPGRQPASG